MSAFSFCLIHKPRGRAMGYLLSRSTADETCVREPSEKLSERPRVRPIGLMGNRSYKPVLKYLFGMPDVVGLLSFHSLA